MRIFVISSLLVVISLAGCTTERQTTTARTATEELLVSTAAERAASSLASALPVQSSVYLDDVNMTDSDGKYAVSAIQDALLRRGCVIAAKQAGAAIVISLRAGALAMNNSTLLLGIPALTLPIPLSGAITTPQVAFYGVDKQQGIAAFYATATDAKSGRWVASAGPAFGQAHVKHYTLLLLFGWHRQDIIPKPVQAELAK